MESLISWKSNWYGYQITHFEGQGDDPAMAAMIRLQNDCFEDFIHGGSSWETHWWRKVGGTPKTLPLDLSKADTRPRGGRGVRIPMINHTWLEPTCIHHVLAPQKIDKVKFYHCFGRILLFYLFPGSYNMYDMFFDIFLYYTVYIYIIYIYICICNNDSDGKIALTIASCRHLTFSPLRSEQLSVLFQLWR